MAGVRKSIEVTTEEARAAVRALLEGHPMGPTDYDDFRFATSVAVYLISWAARRSPWSAQEIAERMATSFEARS